MSRPLKTCTFQETCGVNGVATAHKARPCCTGHREETTSLLPLRRDVLRRRLGERQNRSKTATDANCLIGARRSQVPGLSRRRYCPCRHGFSSACPSSRRSTHRDAPPTHAHRRAPSIDYAAYHAEGQIKEARDRLSFLQGTQRFRVSATCTACSAETSHSFRHPLVRRDPARPGTGGSPRHHLRALDARKKNSQHPPQNLLFFILLKYKTTQSDERTFNPLFVNGRYGNVDFPRPFDAAGRETAASSASRTKPHNLLCAL